MTINLETLVLEFQADFSGFDTSLDRASDKATKALKSLENIKIKPQVDFSGFDFQLKQIEQRQEAILNQNKSLSNQRIKTKVVVEGKEDLELVERVTGSKASTSATKRVQADLKIDNKDQKIRTKALEGIMKSVEKEISTMNKIQSKKQGGNFLGSALTGFTSSVLTGFTQSFSRTLSVDLAKKTNLALAGVTGRIQDDLGTTIPDFLKGFVQRDPDKPRSKSTLEMSSEKFFQNMYQSAIDKARSKVDLSPQSVARFSVSQAERRQAREAYQQNQIEGMTKQRRFKTVDREKASAELKTYQKNLRELEAQKEGIKQFLSETDVTQLGEGVYEDYAKQLKTLNKSISAAETNIASKAESLGVIKKEIESIDRALANYVQSTAPDIVKDLLKEIDPKNFSDNTPSLVVDDEGLAFQGALAEAIPTGNILKVSSDLKKALDSGVLSLEQLETVLHELQHLSDFNYGKDAQAKQRVQQGQVNLGDTTLGAAAGVSGFAGQYSENRVAAEIRAEAIAKQKAAEIYNSRRSTVDLETINELKSALQEAQKLRDILTSQGSEPNSDVLSALTVLDTELATLSDTKFSQIDTATLKQKVTGVKTGLQNIKGMANVELDSSISELTNGVLQTVENTSRETEASVDRVPQASKNLQRALVDLLDTEAPTDAESLKGRATAFKNQFKSAYADMKEAVKNQENDTAAYIAQSIISLSNTAQNEIDGLVADLKDAGVGDKDALHKLNSLKGVVGSYRTNAGKQLKKLPQDEGEGFQRLGEGFTNKLKNDLDGLAKLIGAETGDTLRETLKNLSERVSGETGDALVAALANLTGSDIVDGSKVKTLMNVALSDAGRDMIKELTVNLSGAIGAAPLSQQMGIDQTSAEMMIVPVVRKGVTDIESVFLAYNKVMEESTEDTQSAFKKLLNVVNESSNIAKERSNQTKEEIAKDVIGTFIGNTSANQMQEKADINVPLRGAAVAMPTTGLAYTALTKSLLKATELSRKLAASFETTGEVLQRMGEDSELGMTLEELLGLIEESQTTIEALSLEGIDTSEAESMLSELQETYQSLTVTVEVDTESEGAENSAAQLEDNFTDAVKNIRGQFAKLRSFIKSIPQAMSAGLVAGASLVALTKLTGKLRELADASTEAYMNAETTRAALIGLKGTGADAALSTIWNDAMRLGNGFAAAKTEYTNFVASVQGTSLELQADSLFTSLQEIASLRKLDDEGFSNSLRALNQIASKGTVQMEELRGQLSEAMPGAFQAAARSMNMTTAELDEFVGTGNLTATRFIPKLIAQLEAESKAFADLIPDTLAEKMTRVENLQGRLNVEIGKSMAIVTKPAYDILAKGLTLAANSAGFLTTSMLALSAALGVTFLVSAAKALKALNMLSATLTTIKLGATLGAIGISAVATGALFVEAFRPAKKEFQDINDQLQIAIDRMNKLKEIEPPEAPGRPQASSLVGQVGDAASFLTRKVLEPIGIELKTFGSLEFEKDLLSYYDILDRTNELASNIKLKVLNVSEVDDLRNKLEKLTETSDNLSAKIIAARISEDTKTEAKLTEKLTELERQRSQLIEDRFGLSISEMEATLVEVEKAISGVKKAAADQGYDATDRVKALTRQKELLEDQISVVKNVQAATSVSLNRLDVELGDIQGRLGDLSAGLDDVATQKLINLEIAGMQTGFETLEIELETNQASLAAMKQELQNISRISLDVSLEEQAALDALQERYEIDLDTASLTDLEELLEKAEGLELTENVKAVVASRIEAVNLEREINKERLQILRQEKELAAAKIAQATNRARVSSLSTTDIRASQLQNNEVNIANKELAGKISQGAAELLRLNNSLSQARLTIESNTALMSSLTSTLEASFSEADVDWFLNAIGQPTSSLAEAIATVSDETLNALGSSAIVSQDALKGEMVTSVQDAVAARQSIQQARLEMASSQQSIRETIRAAEDRLQQATDSIRQFSINLESQIRDAQDEVAQLKLDEAIARLSNQIMDSFNLGSNSIFKQGSDILMGFLNSVKDFESGQNSVASESERNKQALSDLRLEYRGLTKELQTAQSELGSLRNPTVELKEQFTSLTETIGEFESALASTAQNNTTSESDTQQVSKVLQGSLKGNIDFKELVKVDVENPYKEALESVQNEIKQLQASRKLRSGNGKSLEALARGQAYDPSRFQGEIPGITPTGIDQARHRESELFYKSNMALNEQLAEVTQKFNEFKNKPTIESLDVTELDISANNIKAEATNSNIDSLGALQNEILTIQSELNRLNLNGAFSQASNQIAKFVDDLFKETRDTINSFKSLQSASRDLRLEYGLMTETDLSKNLNEVDNRFESQANAISSFTEELKEKLGILAGVDISGMTREEIANLADKSVSPSAALNQSASELGIDPSNIGQLQSLERILNEGSTNSAEVIIGLLEEANNLADQNTADNAAARIEVSARTKEANASERRSFNEGLADAFTDTEDMELQLASNQKLIDLKKEIIELEERGVLSAQQASKAKTEAINRYTEAVKTNQIESKVSFKLMESFATATASQLANAFEGIGKSIGESISTGKNLLSSLKDMTLGILQDIVSSVASAAAKIAAQQMIKGIFGGAAGGGGFLGSLATSVMGSVFKDGGTVGGGQTPMNIGGPLGHAVSREGKGAQIIVAHKGEEILTTRNGDAQFLRSLKKSGRWQDMKNSANIANYSNGGTVGKGSYASKLSRASKEARPSITNVNSNIVYNLKGDANVLRQSVGQIETERMRRINNQYNRDK